MSMQSNDARLAALHERYRASLPNKHAELDLAWHSLCEASTDVERFQTLRRVVHRLAGSAASYGYAELGAVAVATDLMLADAAEGLASVRLERIEPHIRALLDGLAKGSVQDKPA